MMKMMIYRTYPLVNYTIDPEHQHFFVETNLPTHQKPEIAEKSPDFIMEALPAGFMDDFPLLCWAMPEGQRNSFDWSNDHYGDSMDPAAMESFIMWCLPNDKPAILWIVYTHKFMAILGW